MNERIIIAATLSLLLLGACKKNETATTKKYLEGSLSIECVNYIKIGQSVHFKTDHRLYHPENGTLSYAWKIANLMSESVPAEGPDNDFSYMFTKDSLATYTVTCTVSPSGDYYATSASAYITTVKGGIGINKAGDTYECSLPLDYDAAKGDQIYSYPQIDDCPDYPKDSAFVSTTLNGKEWMRCNLITRNARTSGTTGAAKRAIGASYRGYKILDNTLGVYYNWNEAIDACPDGWHLPSDAEWTAMAQSVASAGGIAPVPVTEKNWEGVAGEMTCFFQFNGADMVEYQPKVNRTDRSRLSIKMFGQGTAGKYFNFFGEKAVFWTATDYAADNKKAWCRFFSYDSPDVLASPMDKASFYAQVRCIKD